MTSVILAPVTTTLFPQATQTVSLSWTNDVNGGTLLSQVVYYGLNDTANETNYTQLVANTTTALSLTLASGADYRFWVVMVTNNGGTINSTSSPVKTVNTTVLVPNAPTLPASITTRGEKEITLTWSQDNETYNTTATSFSIIYTPDGGSTDIETVVVGVNLTASSGSGTSVDPYVYTYTLVVGLIDGAWYEVSILALNDNGASPSSGFIRIQTSGVPTVPLNFAATTAKDVSIPVSFEAPANDYGHTITNYVVRVNDANSDDETLVNIPVASLGGAGINGDPYTYTLTTADLDDTSANSSITGVAGITSITSFVNGTEYTLFAYAINSEGDGDETSNTVTPTPSAVPSESVALVATSWTDAQSALSWVFNNNGSNITNQTLKITYLDSDNSNALTYVTLSEGALTSTGTSEVNNTISASAESFTVTGLTNGILYTFTVNAENDSGISNDLTDTATPSDIPSVNTALVATSWQNTKSALSWVFNNNGSNITNQTLKITYLDSDNSNALTYVTLSEGALTSTGTSEVNNTISASAESFTVTGLTNGILYTFTVNAENDSGISNDLTDTAVPGTNTDLTFTASSYYNEYIPMVFSVNTIPSAELSEYTLTVINVTGLTVSDLTVNGGTASKAEINGSTVYTITNGATDATLGGLTNGTPYSLTLVAVPNNGDELTQTLTNLIPATAPSAPTSLAVANAYNVSTYAGELDVTWAAPTSDGGAAVNNDGYGIEWSTSINFTANYGSKINITGFTDTLTGLTEGNLYYIRMFATNAAATATSGQQLNKTADNAATNTVYGQVELTNVAHFTGNTL